MRSFVQRRLVRAVDISVSKHAHRRAPMEEPEMELPPAADSPMVWLRLRGFWVLPEEMEEYAQPRCETYVSGTEGACSFPGCIKKEK